MKQYEKEIIQLQLNHEKDVLKELKEMYEEAEKQIDDKIQQLMADEQTQSKIYQLEYQKAIKGQISTILDNMNSHNYDYISDYLKQCYEDGYLSTMYSLHKQGIPLILPIDQELVVKAIQLDSKLSKPLYESLGINTNDLKKVIRREVSRGISNGYSYRDIARNIRNQMNIGLNKSIRIARTEGHRVNQESTMDGIYAAKEKGADIVKQWDATLDKKTRPSHQRVDGEIREIDERFSNGLMFPGDPEGSAGEVINCRCVLLQRARWAIDDETGNTKWDNENRKLITIDSKNYQDFKKKYLENVDNIGNVDYNDSVLYRRRISKLRDAEVIDEPTYNKLTKKFKKSGGILIRSEESTRILEKQKVDGGYFWGSQIILFRIDATVSEVLEEIYHWTQDVKKMNSDKPDELRDLLNEIDAQKYLLSMTEKYKIPQKEVEQTTANLKGYEEDLKRYYEQMKGD